MPIYEFYCVDCHTIFSFLARTPGARKMPACPRCGRRELERRVSVFAISKGRAEPAGGDAPSDLDDTKMEQAMAELAQEARGLNEDDPRQIARLMRRLYEGTGLQLGPGMEEAMRRMEAGEDPDKIEQEMGELLEGEEALTGNIGDGIKSLRRRTRPPSRDDTLHEL